MIFTVELLPALHGDALWIEYGRPDRPHRILIDGGPSSSITRKAIEGLISDRIGTLADGQTDFELIVVTHIDADHITGMLSLLEKRSIALRPRDVWFNGWEHLPDDMLGAKQGERLSAAIVRRRMPWNDDFDGRAAMLPDDGPPPVVELPGGMVLTLLSPTRQALAELRPVWKAEVEKAGLVPGRAAEDERSSQPDVLGDDAIDPDALAEVAFVEDDSEANGSSIAFLAEFDGKSVLLTGDAHAGILADGLRRLARQRGTDTVEVDAFKLPHHGSKFNVSPAVLDLVDCGRYLFSTNGDRFRHPEPVAISRIITTRDDISLEFNYQTEFTAPWESRRLQRRFRYHTVFPNDDEPWLKIQL